jgi:transcriptional regulator with XRE-family HTH domain
MTPGETIALLRRQQGLTQEALAERADTTQRHISQIENGDQQPGLPMLQGIAEALNMPAWVLLYGQPNIAIEILSLLEDCSKEEQTQLFDTLTVLKPIVRQHLTNNL